jgi:hypothetical protein
MKSTSLNRTLQAVAACALLGFGSSTWALSTWTTTGCTTATTAGGTVTEANANDTGSNGTAATYVTRAINNQYSCTSVGTLGTSTTTVATTKAYSTSAAGATFATAYLSPNGSSGFGVKNQTEGLNVGANDHAMDNNGQTDLISFNFGTALVALTNVGLGWSNTDADLSVLRFIGTSTQAAAGITGKTTAQLLTSGWSLGATVNDGSTAAFNATGLTSSWWLVSAFDAGYGGGTSATGNDYVKLLSVAGNVSPPGTDTNRVPEPGSLALIGLGLLGLLGTSRRKAKGLTA